MEMSVELIMVITVTVVVAGIAVFLVQSQSSDLSEVLSGQKDGAQCELYKSEYKSKVCRNDEPESAISVEQPSDCTIPSGFC
jgi:hypothetical protein